MDDTARAEMRELMARYPDSRSALLPMLHLVQSYEGYVTGDGIETCAAELGLTEAEVAAVATFYTMYKRHPMGEYHVGVCTNTLCAVMGGDAIWSRLSEHLGVGHDEVTDDGRISLERVECNAACDYAPVVMVNWEFCDRQSPDSAVALVEALRSGEEVTATRGARICTFKQSERVIAGFSDGRAGEGPAAGEPSLRGLRLARENDWAAPPMPPEAREEPEPPAPEPQAASEPEPAPEPVVTAAEETAAESETESGGPEQPSPTRRRRTRTRTTKEDTP